MLLKTHYAITAFFILLFLPHVDDKLIFAAVALVSTALPDIDSRYSSLGRKRLNRLLQWFTRHRGVIHSFTFLVLITLVLIFFFPVLGFGFFLGYSLHLLADSFTPDGIAPFYPLKKKSCGSVKTGGLLELGLLSGFVFVDALLFLERFLGVL